MEIERALVMTSFNEKSKDAYNKKADGYDSSREGEFTRKFHRLLLSEMAWKENYSVLDVACGTGSLLAEMNARKVIRGYGIDISDKMIKNAIAKNPGMEFRTAGCEAIPFQNDMADIIIVSAAFHHFPDVGAFAREAKRVIKPNGMLYIADMYLPSLVRFVLNPFVPLIFKDGDVKLYSPKEIAHNFERFGFEEVSVKITGNIQLVTMRKLSVSLL